MDLQPEAREQLQQAFIKIFRSYNELKRFSTYKLGENLEVIVQPTNIADAAFELIEWAESKGRLPELIEAAWKENSKSPPLQAFIAQVWKPLQSQQEPAISSQGQLSIQTLIEPPLPAEKLGEPQSSLIVDIRTRTRHAMPKDTEDTTHTNRDTEVAFSESLLPFPQTSAAQQKDNQTIILVEKLYEYITTARKSIQVVYNIFLPEKEVFSDQCPFVIKQMQIAHENIGPTLMESLHTLSIHVPARSLLEVEQTHFCDEAGKTMIFLQDFASQTSSLPLRKHIWHKLELLMRSLQELDGLIDALRRSIEEEKVNN